MIVPQGNLEVLVSPTLRCNLRCQYCYARRGGNERALDMSIDDMGVAFGWLHEYARLIRPDLIRLSWFGGEPTLLGAGYLEEALLLQEVNLRGFNVVCNIQTNLFFDPEPFLPVFHRFFRSAVGFSCDTPGGYRHTPSGRDVTETVEQNVRFLQDNGITLGAVCTVTGRDVGRGREIYDYFKKLGVRFRVNRAASAPGMRRQGLLLSVEQYEDLIIQIANCYLNDPNPTIAFHNVDLMLAAYLKGSAMICVDVERPERYMGLEAQGRIMPRCRFLPAIGDYRYDSAEAIFHRFRKMAFPYSRPQNCASCEFFGRVCIGGCAGEATCDCVYSDCGYRTETTCRLWNYVKGVLAERGLTFGMMRKCGE